MIDLRGLHSTLAWALAMSFGALAAPAPSAAQSGPALVRNPQPTVSTTRLEKTIHELVNRERVSRGLKPLAWDGSLATVARTHSQDMAKRGYFGHLSPEGEGFDKRYGKARYRCALRVGDTVHLGAENIALGNLYASVTTLKGVKYFNWNTEGKIARTAVQGWMASPGHRANILAPYWKREGVGVGVAPDRQVYVTQNFC